MPTTRNPFSPTVTALAHLRLQAARAELNGAWRDVSIRDAADYLLDHRAMDGSTPLTSQELREAAHVSRSGGPDVTRAC